MSLSTMRRAVSTIRERPNVSCIKGVTHHEADERVEIEMDDPCARPRLHLDLQDLPHLLETHREVSLVPVTGFGWIQIFHQTKRYTSDESERAPGTGLCYFIVKQDTTLAWSKMKPESRLESSVLCQFTDLLVKVADGIPGNYPPCIDEDGLKWLRGKGLTRDADYKSSDSASSSRQDNTLQHVDECCICMEPKASHAWSNCNHPEPVVCEDCGKQFKKGTPCPVCRTKGKVVPFKKAPPKK